MCTDDDGASTDTHGRNSVSTETVRKQYGNTTETLYGNTTETLRKHYGTVLVPRIALFTVIQGRPGRATFACTEAGGISRVALRLCRVALRLHYGVTIPWPRQGRPRKFWTVQNIRGHCRTPTGLQGSWRIMTDFSRDWPRFITERGSVVIRNENRDSVTWAWQYVIGRNKTWRRSVVGRVVLSRGEWGTLNHFSLFSLLTCKNMRTVSGSCNQKLIYPNAFRHCIHFQNISINF